MISSLFSYLFGFISTFYTLVFSTGDSGNISMSQYQNKSVLIVNIASQSQYQNQIADLQELSVKYADSLVVLAFPSNSFGHEPLVNNEASRYYYQRYGATFPIAVTAPVSGAGIQPVYAWLLDAQNNGGANGSVANDFQKFLISPEGDLIGVFSPDLPVTSTTFIAAINYSFQAH